MACAHVDGSSRGNPGPGSCAAVFHGRLGDQNSPIFVENLEYVTSNEAEYHGLLLALRQAHLRGVRTLHVYSDSQVLVKQIHGKWKVRAENLGRLHAQALALMREFDLVVIQFIPRERNKLADKHSRSKELR